MSGATIACATNNILDEPIMGKKLIEHTVAHKRNSGLDK